MLLDDVRSVLQCVTTMAKHALLCDMMLWGRKSLVASSLALGDSSRMDGQLDVCAGEMANASNVFYRIHGLFIFISYFCMVQYKYLRYGNHSNPGVYSHCSPRLGVWRAARQMVQLLPNSRGGRCF